MIVRIPLDPDTHAKALAEAKAKGREATARRYGIGVATLERALAWANLTPLARRAIETAVGSPEYDASAESKSRDAG